MWGYNFIFYFWLLLDMKSLRFGASTTYVRIPPKNWIKTVQRIEELGYSTLFEDDHFGTLNYDPIVLLSAAAAATKKNQPRNPSIRCRLPTPRDPSENSGSITPIIKL